ncbi:class I SAM-dependent methyltransferase [Paenibacillus fonticola]|uniref:class I SAM-dependent methyltransferase n=1 Tax=Paenibacillus fonticola TaxID=379896 RepID=UPI0003699532|nr:class I SAM-dependent methyltransferase [Paenibacillus fonticola]
MQNLYDNETFFNMYKKLRETRVTHNDFIEQPAMKRLLPELKGLKVLDLGCGFGEMAHYCIEKGAAQVTGIDISEKMLSAARPHPQIRYLHCPMEEVECNRHEFDIVISSLAFHYIKDYELLIRRIANWIKPRGYLVFSTEHPVILAHQSQKGWIRDSDSSILHWPIDNYGEEGSRAQFWGIDGVIKYHRKLSTLINVLIQNGLTVQEVDEPESIAEGLAKKPTLLNEKRRPSFILIKARKQEEEWGGPERT